MKVLGIVSLALGLLRVYLLRREMKRIEADIKCRVWGSGL
jgi:hypothetical protein